MSTRYTAVIKIVRVDEFDASTYRNESKPARKDETELASIITRHGDLEKLVANVQSHLELVEDIK